MKKLEYVYKYLVEGTREVMDDDDKVWFDYNFDKRCKYIEEQFIIKPETDLKGLSKFIGEVIDKLESSQKYHDEMNKPPKPEVTRIFNEDDYGFIISYLDSDLNIFECVECWQKAKKYVSYFIQDQEQQQEIKELNNLKALPPQPIKTKQPTEKKTLSDLITHQKSVEIVKGIKIQYKNIKGKRLKLLLLALQELNLLPNERIAQKFHDCCKAEFGWDVASYTAMNDYQFNEYTDKIELDNMKKFLEKIIQTK